MALPRLLVFISLLGAPSVASAEKDLVPDYQVGVRALLGAIDVGELGGTSYGVGVHVRLPLEYVTLALEQDGTGANLEDENDGARVHSSSYRGRALVQLPLLELQHKRFRGGLTASAGLGYEYVLLEDRDSVRRDFLTWGLDSVNGFATKRGDFYVGIDYGFRIDLARAPREPKRVRPPGCSGPCDVATVNEPIDVSVVMGLTVSWGML